MLSSPSFWKKKYEKTPATPVSPHHRILGTMATAINKIKTSRKRRGVGYPILELPKKRRNFRLRSAPNCDADLSNAETSKTEKRKKIDIVYEVVETTFISETKICPECGEKNKEEFPEGIDGKVQYGNGIKAAIINFLMVQMISLQRVQEHFKGLIGRAISQGVMLKYIAQFSCSLSSWEERMKEELFRAPVIYVDETSMRVDKKNYWVHSYSAGDTVLQFVHPSRGIEAIDDIGILPKYGGIIVHDCWSSYFSYGNLEHALCNAHILRELKFIEGSTGHQWATRFEKTFNEGNRGSSCKFR